jgi:multidrug efflux system outer membrane protein
MEIMTEKNMKLQNGYLRLCIPAVTFVFCLELMSGCTVGPNYKPPQTNVPAAWYGPNIAAEPNMQAQQDIVHWWANFGDEKLTSLIGQAFQSNLDLKIAESRIGQARAARGVVAGGFWPSVNAAAAASRSRTAGLSRGAINSLYEAGFDAAWEMDIFGGVRRNIEAAEADVQAAIENRRGVLVTLAAEVALDYIDIRAFQQQVVIAKNNLHIQMETAKLTRKRFNTGFVGALDVANADAQTAATASQIPLLESSIQQTIYSLSILFDREPSALMVELIDTSSIPTAPLNVPAGVPSDLLRRRPDIRSAEAGIHSATARVGVAVAELFPKFSLSGSAGYQSSQSSTLTNWNNRFWSIGPSASWPIFAGGSIVSNIELQKALEEQSLIVYRQTVLNALQEVENALIASYKEQQHRDELNKAVTANRKAVQLATQLYTQGQIEFLNVLQTQAALYATEDALVQSNRTVSTNLVALYKALGGGWVE